MAPDDEDSVAEFAAERAATNVSSVPEFVPEDRTTRPHETIDDATFQAGFIAGRAEAVEEWRAFGREEVYEGLRLALIASKSDPGVAHLHSERLRRWMEDPANATLVEEVVRMRKPI